jgi:hypothetical protein
MPKSSPQFYFAFFSSRDHISTPRVERPRLVPAGWLSGSDPRLALQLPSSARITGNTEVLSRNVRIADDTETISLWLNAHVLSTADSAFNRLLSDLNSCCDR